MRKTTRRSSRAKKIEVILVRPTEDDVKVNLPKGATVEDALEELGFDLPSGQSLYVGSDRAEMEDELQDGDVMQVVGKKEGGSNN